MSTVITRNGTPPVYKDWDSGPVVISKDTRPIERDGAPHGIADTRKDRLDADRRTFPRS